MRIKQTTILSRRCLPGFTLVELLVVIAILAVLASLAFVAAQRGLVKAAASKSLSRLRQSGMMLLVNAQDEAGKARYSLDGNARSAGWDTLPYNIVRSALGINTSGQGADLNICESMHWDSVKLHPKVYQVNCFGVNYTDLPDNGVVWNEEIIPAPDSYSVRSLVLASVIRPESYPLLVDSSDSKGDEISQIVETSSDLVGLRNSGKAHGYFLDGSARELGLGDLKQAGFSKVYDNSTRPPKLRTL
ncbi:MAG: type II secretion system protein [Luteolibacter sp.]